MKRATLLVIVLGAVLWSRVGDRESRGDADVLAALGVPGVHLKMRLAAVEEIRPDMQVLGYGHYADSSTLGDVGLQFDGMSSVTEGQPSSPRARLRYVTVQLRRPDEESWAEMVDMVSSLRDGPICDELTTSRPMFERHRLDIVFENVIIQTERTERSWPDGRSEVHRGLTVSTGLGRLREAAEVDCDEAIARFPWEESE